MSAAPALLKSPPISEAELIEIENRAAAISTAERIIEKKMAKKERREGSIPYALRMDSERLAALRDDIRRLINIARSGGSR